MYKQFNEYEIKQSITICGCEFQNGDKIKVELPAGTGEYLKAFYRNAEIGLIYNGTGKLNHLIDLGILQYLK